MQSNSSRGLPPRRSTAPPIDYEEDIVVGALPDSEHAPHRSTSEQQRQPAFPGLTLPQRRGGEHVTQAPVEQERTAEEQGAQQLQELSLAARATRTAGASAPEGMRFCTGCRKPQMLEDFEKDRKMCTRHKGRKKRSRKKKGADASDSDDDGELDSPPTPLLSYATLSSLLRAGSEKDGVSSLSASCSLTSMPGWSLVDIELKAPFVVIGGESELPSEDLAEARRRARARARPLVDAIHEATGYSFVYKDCRQSQKKKYLHSLRYLCAQRQDQDNTKRKSAEKAAEKKARLARGEPEDQSDVEEDDRFRDLFLGSDDEEDRNDDDNVRAGPSSQLYEQEGSISASASPAPAPAPNCRSRANLKRMVRFDCRGSLIINIMRNNTTAYFTITHHLQHAHYVDVVGNRLRGAKYHPLPVNLLNTIEAPRAPIEIGKSEQTMLERAEETFSELLQLVKELKAKKGGGEEEAARELYLRTEACRSWRVSVLEALQKGGTGVPKPEKVKEPRSRKKKRAVSEVDGAEDEGAGRVGSGFEVEGDMQVELHYRPQEELDDPLRYLRLEHFIQGIDADHLAALQQELPPLPDLPQQHNPLRHQLGDTANGDQLTVDYSALAEEVRRGALDPNLS